MRGHAREDKESANVLQCIVLLILTLFYNIAYAQSSRLDKTSGQLLIQGKPLLILGGELGNSSAGTAEQADSDSDGAEPTIMQVYGVLSDLGGMLPEAQAANRTRGMVLHANSARGTQTVVLGGYLFQGSLSRAWSTGSLLAADGGMLLLESAPNEFLVVGSGLTVKMTRDPDVDSGVAGIANIEEESGNNLESHCESQRRPEQPGSSADNGRTPRKDLPRQTLLRFKIISLGEKGFLPRCRLTHQEATKIGVLRWTLS
jgi:hypothetical protein